MYLETSAKTGGGVDGMFMEIAKECSKREREKQEKMHDDKGSVDAEDLVDITVTNGDRKKKCC
eukprot:gnl/Chilomastix_caulleri/2455.p3 GENE.gnl/Chilomastix_caulleri/2455~~gnl/Chilomastix_caulleri/2455.p3  ORF type:complete len:63 (+),score=20.22 gnl/Chilomastix_caulleri/2455:470-658(+)